MKRILFLFIWLLSGISWGATPREYSTQVLQKDLPQIATWYQGLSSAQSLGQVEVYELYRQAMPDPQPNQQSGISVQGSVGRALLLLDGASYFSLSQQASPELQKQKEAVVATLQAVKDQLDRFQFGEDPQNLWDEWQKSHPPGDDGFVKNLTDVLTQTQQMMVQIDGMSVGSVVVEAEYTTPGTDDDDGHASVEAEQTSSEPVAPAPDDSIETPTVKEAGVDGFELQRFSSYIENAETGSTAPECQNATSWQTDKAGPCDKDETAGCDRSYARQCKKLP